MEDDIPSIGNKKVVPEICSVNTEDKVDSAEFDHEDVSVEQSIQLDNKAAFREQSAALREVLNNSTKFRRLPEPTGLKPGRLEELGNAWDNTAAINPSAKAAGVKKVINYERPLSRQQKRGDSEAVKPTDNLEGGINSGLATKMAGTHISTPSYTTAESSSKPKVVSAQGNNPPMYVATQYAGAMRHKNRGTPSAAGTFPALTQPGPQDSSGSSSMLKYSRHKDELKPRLKLAEIKTNQGEVKKAVKKHGLSRIAPTD